MAMQRLLSYYVCRSFSSGSWLASGYRVPIDPDKWRHPDEPPEARPHPETPQFPGEYSPHTPQGRPKGKIYDKKPFKVVLEPGRKYSYCTCGHSHTQPFCDGSHRRLDGTSEVKRSPKFRPIIFEVEEAKEYFLCNCKQSNNRPFCDGTHRRKDIQGAVR